MKKLFRVYCEECKEFLLTSKVSYPYITSFYETLDDARKRALNHQEETACVNVIIKGLEN